MSFHDDVRSTLRERARDVTAGASLPASTLRRVRVERAVVALALACCAALGATALAVDLDRGPDARPADVPFEPPPPPPETRWLQRVRALHAPGDWVAVAAGDEGSWRWHLTALETRRDGAPAVCYEYEDTSPFGGYANSCARVDRHGLVLRPLGQTLLHKQRYVVVVVGVVPPEVATVVATAGDGRRTPLRMYPAPRGLPAGTRFVVGFLSPETRAVETLTHDGRVAWRSPTLEPPDAPVGPPVVLQRGVHGGVPYELVGREWSDGPCLTLVLADEPLDHEDTCGRGAAYGIQPGVPFTPVVGFVPQDAVSARLASGEPLRIRRGPSAFPYRYYFSLDPGARESVVVRDEDGDVVLLCDSFWTPEHVTCGRDGGF